MNGISIVGTGSYIPKHCIDNTELSKYVDTSDEWIRTRTGIRKRHFCGEGENTRTMAIEAAKEIISNATKNKKINKDEIGVVVVATSTANELFPSTACMVSKALELSQEVMAFDISAACSGFLYGIQIVKSLLECSEKKYALLIGSEQISRIVDFKDRSTCVLFGDGASGILISLNENYYLHKSWSLGNYQGLSCKGAGYEDQYLKMDGKQVFKFAVKSFENAIHQLVEESGIHQSDIDLIIPHQANERIIECVKKKFKDLSDRFYVNIGEYANTSAASIPIAINELFEKKKLKNGMTIMCVSFGAGFTWSGVLMEI
ncbi:MAG: ketoacyl-ACP synthase III [Lachnospiraceae bacterium]|nr:ketoacyl-ACP synthase III [Lachnospiraceae bacterium]